MEAAWRGAEMRNVSQTSLLNNLRLIKCGKLTRLERENIGRRVRRQYICQDAIMGADEDLNKEIGELEELEEREILDEDASENPN